VSHFKICSQILTEAIHSNHSYLVVYRIPPSAIPTGSKMPRLLMAVRIPTLHPLQLPPFVLRSYFCTQFSAPAPALTTLHLRPAPPLPLPRVLLVRDLHISTALANLLYIRNTLVHH